MPPRKRPEIQDLLAQARRDLEVAEANVGIEKYEAAAFYCQQSVEKGLKALHMHLRRRRADPTHDLTRLGEAAQRAGHPAHGARRTDDRLHERPVSRNRQRPAVQDLHKGKSAEPSRGRQGDLEMARPAVLKRDPVIRRFMSQCLPKIVAQYAPREVWLFGSRVQGDALEHSDLDVIIVAEAFRSVDWLDRPTPVRLECGVRNADIFCYTPDEFARKRRQLGTVRAAVEEGVQILTPSS